MASSSMSSESSTLFSLARSKLHLSVGGKDSCSLHRWVLLKNSIIRSPSLTSPVTATDCRDVNIAYHLDDGDDDADEEIGSEEEVDSFMFPDAGKFVDDHTADVNASEAEWLDSLLETLGDDDEDDFAVDSHVSIIPADDDDSLLSPMGSPMSSSDDLPHQPAYYPPPVTVHCPVPYPPFHPPLLNSYHFDATFDLPLASLPPPYDDPFPYHSLDDIEDLSVPDAIEDTSDDDSDAPPTPSVDMSRSSLCLIDAASIPLPTDRSGLRLYVGMDDSYFDPFDSLPFSDRHHHLRHNSYNNYQEC